jgi:hypothetical protein
MKLFFVATGKSTAEIEAIKQVRPKRLLLSYFYFKNKPLQGYIDQIGYKPEILLDSGAYSAHTQGKGIALTDYMKYITDNQELISDYINLDVFADNELSFQYYKIMRMKGFSPVPVVHYGQDDEFWLQRYLDEGEKHIALGGTVPVKDKNQVSEWVRLLTWMNPGIKFHLLGSSSKKIINHCDLYSVDSSTWFMMAVHGFPKHINGRDRKAKIQRAAWQLEKQMNLERGFDSWGMQTGAAPSAL